MQHKDQDNHMKHTDQDKETQRSRQPHTKKHKKLCVHMWMSHGIHRGDKETQRSRQSHTPIVHTCVPRLIHACDWNILPVTWLIHICDMTRCTCATNNRLVTSSLVYAMTCSNVWHDPFMCVTWLIHMCDMTRSYVWYDPLILVTWTSEWTNINKYIYIYIYIHIYIYTYV